MAFPQYLAWGDSRGVHQVGRALALPVNEDENRFLTTLAKEKQMEGAWLGARDDNFFEQWFSLDQSELHYFNWDAELLEPIDERSKQHFPVLLVSRNGKWAYEANVSGVPAGIYLPVGLNSPSALQNP